MATGRIPFIHYSNEPKQTTCIWQMTVRTYDRHRLPAPMGKISGVTSGGRGEGGGPPRVTPSGVTPEGKTFLWANLQRIVEKRGRTGIKGVGDTLEGGDTSESNKKR